MIEFNYNNSYLYKTNIVYNRLNLRRTISGYLDTGCAMTSIGLYSLSKLVGKTVDILMEDINYVITKGYPIKESTTAGGYRLRTIPIKLYNIRIGDRTFESLNCFVNIDDALCENDGIQQTIVGTKEKIKPYMLIGLDIIRSCNYTFVAEDYAKCANFDLNKYNYIWSRYSNLLTYYIDLVVEDT